MDSQATLTIPLPRPFSLEYSLESGQAFRWHRRGDWRYGVVSGRLVALRQDGDELHVRAASEPEAVAADVRDYLRIDDDMEAVYARIAADDDRMAQSIAAYPGMRILRQDPWECLIAFICSANSNIPRISANMNDIAASMGEPLTLDDHVGYAFPPPQRLAAAGEQALRDLRLGFRAKYVAGAAELAASGELDVASLRRASYDEAREALIALPGVGDKVADCVLLMSLDKPQAFPVDRWIRRAVEEWYLDGAKRNYNGIREWSWERWGDMAGYANQYLFQLRRLMASGPLGA